MLYAESIPHLASSASPALQDDSIDLSVKEYLADNYMDPSASVHSAASHPTLMRGLVNLRLVALGRAGSVVVSGSNGPAAISTSPSA